jgi:signal peptidase II
VTAAPRSLSANFRLFLTTAVGLLILDQLVKWAARASVDGIEGRSIHPLWAGVFELKLVYNQGVAFGMLQGKGVFLTPIALLIAGFATWHSYRHPQETRFTHLTMALLASGAVGNMIDRLAMGKVTDMFWFRLINFPVFNIADICICVAGAFLVLGAIKEVIRPTAPTPGPDATSTPPGE